MARFRNELFSVQQSVAVPGAGLLQTVRVPIPALPSVSHAPLSVLLSPSVPQLLHLRNGDDDNSHLIGWL